MTRVAVAGAAGRMGQAVCAAVEGADDLVLSGRADPALDVALADVLGDADVVVNFTVPDQALENAHRFFFSAESAQRLGLPEERFALPRRLCISRDVCVKGKGGCPPIKAGKHLRVPKHGL